MLLCACACACACARLYVAVWYHSLVLWFSGSLVVAANRKDLPPCSLYLYLTQVEAILVNTVVSISDVVDVVVAVGCSLH